MATEEINGGGDNGGGDGGNGGNDDGNGGNNGGGNGNGGSDIIPIFDPSPILDDTKNNQVASSIANQLINNVKDFGNTTDAGKLLNDLGLMSPSRVSEALDRLGHRTNTNGINEGVGEFSGMEIEDLLTDIAINMDNLTSEGILVIG
ncbi:hypothetical protein RAS_06140 [Rickettsia asiatica]|uniref:Uncharacterized protein n=1 Tax=Rickettsia asiatica TaxID=238800 RepID=A0A510G9Q2_9RICK|nr:hypothetical protein [Rickettsia asiatica]BBJ31505.1 hypothetical protein RAS_06140 [Rickettsia asiatica]